jgi:hypothetical protein
MKRIGLLLLVLASIARADWIPVMDTQERIVGYSADNVPPLDGTGHFPSGVMPTVGGGSGTVTDFSFTNLNGITGTVTNRSTTPVLSLSLGDITPTSIVASGGISTSSGNISTSSGYMESLGGTSGFLFHDRTNNTKGWVWYADGNTSDTARLYSPNSIDAFTLTPAGSATFAGAIAASNFNGTLSGGGTLATGGFTLTLPATGTAVLTSRNVSAGTGLSGGGSLAADVTLSLPNVGTSGAKTFATGDSITTDAQGRVSAATMVTRSIGVSGLGLSGGGTLAADRTITLTSSSSPGAAASILASASDGGLTLTKYNNVAITAPASLATLTLGSGTTTIVTGGGTLALGGFTGTLPATGTIALATGISGGQTINGGTASGNNLTLNSTSNATKGKIFFGANSAYDGANNRLGIGTTSPSQTIESTGNIFINNPVANLFLKDTSTGFQSAATTVVTPQSGNAFESISYTSGLRGFYQDDNYAEFNNINVRGELRASVFKVNEISATAGTSGTFYSGAALNGDATTPANVTTVASGSNGAALPQATINVASTSGFASTGTIYVEGSSVTYTGKTSTSFTGCSGGSGTIVTGDAVSDVIFSIDAKNSDITASAMLFGLNDILRIKAYVNSGSVIIADLWLKVQTGRVNHGTYTTYPVILMKGSANTTVVAGTAVIDYGPSGTGFITQSADGTIGASPNLTMATHSGTPWNGFTTLMRAGNLNGSYGYAADTYGIGLGQYGTSSGSWITSDTTNGIRIGNNTTTFSQWFTNGDLRIGQTGTSNSNAYIGASDGVLRLRNNTTSIVTLDPTNGLQIFDSTGSTVLSQWLTNGDIKVGQIGAGNSNIYIGASDGLLRLRNNITSVLILDPTNGLRIFSPADGTTLLGLWDMSGNARFGQIGAGQGNILIDAGGTLHVRRATTDYITMNATDAQFTNVINMSGSGAAISLGATPPTSATAGTGIWEDRTGIYSLSAGTQNTTLTSAGISAAGGNVTLSSAGLFLTTGTGSVGSDNQSVLWKSGTTTTSGLWGIAYTGGNYPTTYNTKLYTKTVANSQAWSRMEASNDVPTVAYVDVFQNGSTASPNANKGYVIISGQNFLGANIGSTATPAHMLDVQGTAAIFADSRDALTFDRTANVSITHTYSIGVSVVTADFLRLGPSGADGVRIFNSGGVNVGSDSTDHGAGNLAVTGKILTSSGATITSGTGAPSASEPNGSIYLRTDGTSTTTLYVRASSAWTAK